MAKRHEELLIQIRVEIEMNENIDRISKLDEIERCMEYGFYFKDEDAEIVGAETLNTFIIS